MGNYTEFHFNSALKETIPQEVINILTYMVGDGVSEPPKPDHPLFKIPSWPNMLARDSYYFDADTHSTFRYDTNGHEWYLCIRCNLTNISDEIEHFVDWVMPYLYKETGDFLGFSRYEQVQTPTLIYAK